MTEVEFYAKAQRDDSFRQEHLKEMSYLKNLNRIGFVLGGLASAGYIAYCGVFQHRCPDLGGSIFLLLLCSWGYTHARTKLAALEAINRACDESETVRLQP